jgi:hypothetical protein
MKAVKRRGLEISKRRSAVAVFLRDKSRAPELLHIGAAYAMAAARKRPAASEDVQSDHCFRWRCALSQANSMIGSKLLRADATINSRPLTVSRQTFTFRVERAFPGT